jgi:branched-chain amino acid transport system permease protein
VFALGLSLVYGVSRTLNFAFGSLYMFAAYLIYFLIERFAIGLPAAALCVLPAMFIIGVLLESAIVRPLRRHPNWKMAAMMVTLGLALVLDNLTLVLFGPDQKQLPLLLEGALEFGDVQIGYQDLAVIAIAGLTVAALELFLKYTVVGQAMRAVAQDSQGARMVGIKVDRVFTYTFGLSMVLAGIAAPLLAPVTLVSPQGGWPLFLKAFVIVVFGGLGSTRGTLAAALILGVVESAVLYEFNATWILPVWLLVLLVVLMLRPKGLFGVWAA